MHFSTITIFAPFLAALAIAGPAQPLADRSGDWGEVISYAGDNCDGNSHDIKVTGSGSKRCDAVGGRSIRDVQKRGCTIKTWSGSNCHGSSWTMPDGDFGCHSVLHAAISIDC